MNEEIESVFPRMNKVKFTFVDWKIYRPINISFCGKVIKVDTRVFNEILIEDLLDNIDKVIFDIINLSKFKKNNYDITIN